MHLGAGRDKRIDKWKRLTLMRACGLEQSGNENGCPSSSTAQVARFIFGSRLKRPTHERSRIRD
jgi:hypothetical protein